MVYMNLKVPLLFLINIFLVIWAKWVLYFYEIVNCLATERTMSYAALSVYISLLEEQHKYSDALEILSGNLGSLMMIEVDKLRLKVYCRIFSSSWCADRVIVSYQNILFSVTV